MGSYNSDKIKKFQNNERKFYQQVGGNARRQTNSRTQRKQNNFGAKYGNEKNRKAEWIDNMKKNENAKIHLDLFRTILKKGSNRKSSKHDDIHGF